MKLAKDKNLALPTQEDIGRAFLELKTVKERIAFRKEMEDYGKAIGDLCRDLGIAVNFAPVLDTVDDIDGDNFMEYNDQAYGEEPYVVQLLGFHFVKGLNSVDGVMSSPKHFFGTGKSPNDPHHNEKQQITETTKRDGSVLPFKDVIQGRLLYDKIIRRYEHDTKSFDYYLRRHLGKIRRSKSGRSTRRLNQARKDYRAFLKTHDLTVRDVPEDFMEMPKIQGIMVSHSQNFTNPDTPGTISSEMIKRRLQQNLGFHGIVFTDDLNMGATENFVNGRASEVDNWPAEAFASSLAAGSTMPMLLHHSGEIDAIVERVQRAIDDKEDFDGDGKADITIDIINEAVRLVLETKADAGLLKKSRSSRSRSMFSGKKRPQRTVYENNSREYLRKTIGRR